MKVNNEHKLSDPSSKTSKLPHAKQTELHLRLIIQTPLTHNVVYQRNIISTTLGVFISHHSGTLA